MSARRIAVLYGTRPEAIKVAPVVRALRSCSSTDCLVISTGQHRGMLAHTGTSLDDVAAHDLDVFEPGQSPNMIMSKVLSRLDPLLKQLAPDVLLVQGDTSSAAAGGVSAFNCAIPLVHLEAGLRTGDMASPFPEEGNRRLLGQLASLHLATTVQAQNNLLAEGVAQKKIRVVGNTVVDALSDALEQSASFSDPAVAEVCGAAPDLVTITTHRRENWGEGIIGIGGAVRMLASRLPDHVFVLPLHANPIVRAPLTALLGEVKNVILTEPMGYVEFAHLMARSKAVLTDSGGVQEEASSLGKPLFVLRESTERPEVLTGGSGRLVGTEAERVVESVLSVLSDEVGYEEMVRSANPYPPGRAAPRVVSAIAEVLGGLPDPTAHGGVPCW
ncbi:non-hydrolyzing UDP-N-acetylglucosamine 2-epimerase [Nocardia sp. SC052]|uniref:non-hydrolyzing UDP-N-acetylglucosamine 2-epimerase n=1 Tax=Nocardia sichangensis TaxID=3385975 RepID=UPI0039A1C0AB